MERKEVTRLENKAESLRDYPGEYFPGHVQPKKRLKLPN